MQAAPNNAFHSPKSLDLTSLLSYGSSKTELLASAIEPAPAERPPTAIKTIARKTVKKLLPLGLMLFFILFNYTILRDTKDVLVITAPGSGAEIIPFLKTYVNLPSAIGFTLMYSALCNKMAPDKVFYVVMTAFLTFFGAFAGFICKRHRNLFCYCLY
jgi:AAA family ATP:ADP antiporter